MDAVGSVGLSKPLPYYFFQFPFRGYFFPSEPKVNDIKHPVKKSFSDNILIDTEIQPLTNLSELFISTVRKLQI
jgi:hypothetical protein